MYMDTGQRLWDLAYAVEWWFCIRNKRPHTRTDVEEEAELSDVTEMTRQSSEQFKMPGKSSLTEKMAGEF